ncbi:hypothetical protein K474DRAFT_1667447 [Panus rudis PR-1116 ss-1]|nr:hypothetical protein K474DRAFT_1667447 [Panus rudis PR-1116 ss-1]
MESEDERVLEESRIDHMHDTLVNAHVFEGWPELRLFEHEEHEARRTLLSYRSAYAGESFPEIRPSDCSVKDNVALCRLRRFFAVMEGFHKGCLDLTGRHLHRYQSISKRYADFSNEFRALVRDHGNKVVRYVDNYGEDEAGQAHREELEIRPIEAYEAFLTKWECAHTYTPLELLDVIERADSSIRQHPEPIIQKLCLTQLPPEIMHNVMLILSQDKFDRYKSKPRRLGATCRMLWSIAQNYMYTSTRLQVAYTIEHMAIVNKMEVNGQKGRFLAKLLFQMQGRLIDELQTLLNRPDACRRIRFLNIDDNWTHLARFMGPITIEEHERPGMIQKQQTVATLLPHVLSLATNVREISFGGWDISLAIMRALSSNRHLRKIDFTRCAINIGADPNPPYLPSVDTFEFCFPLDSNTWTVVSMFPNLRYLSYANLRSSVDTNIRNILVMPEPDVQARLNPFNTLEAIVLDRVWPADVEILTVWLQAARPSGLRLKRLRIVVHGGLFREEILELIDALSYAPLKSFILDGIQWADPTLLVRIAQKLPHLESLVLLYRDSERQMSRKYAVWPHPPWIYAQQLSNFPRLRHFGWNSKIESRYTPYTLPWIEDGYPELDDLVRFWKADIDADENDCEEGSRSIAKLLGAYCPSLQYVVFYSRKSYPYERQNDGGSSEFAFNVHLSLREEHYWLDPGPRIKSWYEQDP